MQPKQPGGHYEATPHRKIVVHTATRTAEAWSLQRGMFNYLHKEAIFEPLESSTNICRDLKKRSRYEGVGWLFYKFACDQPI